MALCSATPVWALEYFDEFEDGVLNGKLWTAKTSGGPTLDEAGGELNMFLPSASAGDTFYAALDAKPQPIGDFDIRVEYRLAPYAAVSGVRVGLSVHWTSGTITLERVNHAGDAQMYLMDFGSWWNGFETQETRGTMVFERRGSIVTGYVWKDDDWATVGYWGLASQEPVTFSLATWSHDSHFGDVDYGVHWDNFLAVDSAVPEPAGWLALGIGAAALVLRRRTR